MPKIRDNDGDIQNGKFPKAVHSNKKIRWDVNLQPGEGNMRLWVGDNLFENNHHYGPVQGTQPDPAEDSTCFNGPDRYFLNDKDRVQAVIEYYDTNGQQCWSLEFPGGLEIDATRS